MARHALGHLLSPSAQDWLRHRGHVGEGLGRWLREDLEATQRPNAEVAFCSTPADGLGAGLTPNGRLSVLLAPTTGAGHQLPYYVTGEGPLLGAPPMAGSFAGIDRGDGPGWLWERDVSLAYRGAAGLVDLTYSAAAADGDPRLAVSETAYVAPGSETLVRDFAVEAVDGQARDVEFVYHTRANVNDELQTFSAWRSSPNALTADGELRWRDREGPTELRARLDRPATASGRRAGEDEGRDGEVTGTYLEGRLRTSLDVPADGTARVSVLVTAGEQPTWDRDLLGADQRERQAAAERWWEEWLPAAGPGDRSRPASPAGPVDGDPGGPERANGGARPAVERESRAAATDLVTLRRRSIAVLAALADPASGSLSASPNLQPTYYPTWPRDAAFAAVALARVGKPAPARAVLAEFLPGVQEADGSFRQCYDSAGRFAGVVPVEADQQPLYAWGVREVYRELDDPAFLEATWPTVRDALTYAVENVGADGLLAPTPDVDEYPDAVRQSLWSNAWAYRGLLDGAALAAAVGADPGPFRRAAGLVGESLAREFFREDGYVTHRDAGGDHRELHAYDAVAVHPTEWAGNYGEAGRLLADLRELARGDVRWVPGDLLLATALFRHGEVDLAEAFLERVAAETTAAGHLVEVPADGGTDHHFASPLAWSHAAFLLAMEARAAAQS